MVAPAPVLAAQTPDALGPVPSRPPAPAARTEATGRTGMSKEGPHVCLLDVDKRPAMLRDAMGAGWWVWPDCLYESRAEAMGWLAGCEAADHGAQLTLAEDRLAI